MLTEAEAIPYEPALLRGERLLVLAPHPDDEVIGCGGLVALHLREGRAVRVVVATDGAQAGAADVRQQESRRALDRLGNGAELAFGTNDVLVRGLAFSGNLTFVEPKTLAMSGRASATAAPDAAIGKQLPNIPKWRSTATAMYRPNDRFTYTLAARYSSKLYTTLDNVDVRYNTYQGFSEWFVVDTKANYRVNDNWSVSGGIDNLLDRKYFLFHPFPHRTFLAGLKYGYK